MRPYKQRHAKFCGHRCAMLFHQEAVLTAARTPQAIEKSAAARRGRGGRRSYPKLYGRHMHRVVAEQKLGRALRPGEVVHHIDGNKHNNTPANLEVLSSQSEHASLHGHTRVRPRPTHCKRGHPLVTPNVYTYPNGSRVCVICRRVYDNAWKKARRRLRASFPRRPRSVAGRLRNNSGQFARSEP